MPSARSTPAAGSYCRQSHPKDFFRSTSRAPKLWLMHTPGCIRHSIARTTKTCTAHKSISLALADADRPCTPVRHTSHRPTLAAPSSSRGRTLCNDVLRGRRPAVHRCGLERRYRRGLHKAGSSGQKCRKGPSSHPTRFPDGSERSRFRRSERQSSRRFAGRRVASVPELMMPARPEALNFASWRVALAGRR